MLRGNSPAKVDDKGRIKVPTLFRKHIEEKFGRDFFVTSLNGEFVRVYPMPVWMEIEKKLDSFPSMNPSIMRFRNLVSYYGQEASMDDQGRLLIHPLLRRTSGVDGEVAVLGNQNWLDIWNREKLEAALAAQPLTEEDRQVLASLGI
jgi:MraZ protein